MLSFFSPIWIKIPVYAPTSHSRYHLKPKKGINCVDEKRKLHEMRNERSKRNGLYNGDDDPRTSSNKQPEAQRIITIQKLAFTYSAANMAMRKYCTVDLLAF